MSHSTDDRHPGGRRGARWGLACSIATIAAALTCAGWWLFRGANRLPQEPPRVQHSLLPAGPIQLADVSDRVGIEFHHTHGGTGQRYIIEAMTAGLAIFDVDGDGHEDIYFLNGAPLPLGRKVDVPPRSSLFRNGGDWRFTDVTDPAGVGSTVFALGVAAADYDNDGWLDLYVNNFGRNVLYHNNGDGTFTDVTDRAGVANPGKVGAGVCFLDIDGDGDLDLFVASYVQFSYESNPRRFVGGYLRHPSPLDFPAQTDALYRNNGDGTFTDVSDASGIARHAGSGMGVIALDYDNDGDSDLFVCNDVKGNFLFQNDGTGRFKEVALTAGVAYDSFGKAVGSMGPDCADYDNDGWLDLFMTDYQAELPALYHNLGKGFFEDAAMDAGVGPGCREHVKWGCGFADFDNDGRRDLYVANGHIEPFIDRLDPTTAYRAPNALLRNVGGKFLNVSSTAGDGMAVRKSSRGLGLDDLDNDGRTDVVVLNSEDTPTVLRNVTANENHWLQIRLHGTRSNRDGVGARVRVTTGDLVQIDEVHSGRSYQSHYGLRLHFGLGSHSRIDRLEIRWCGSGTDVLADLAADQSLTVIEK